MIHRDYNGLADLPRAIARATSPAAPSTDDHVTLRAQLIDALWDAFGGPGPGRKVSWMGFYLYTPNAVLLPDGSREDGMTLDARRDKPACSPIGLHGACGRAWRSRRALVVTDVANLGAGYIACDPLDKSELVIPLIDHAGRCTAVLDADSYDTHAFTTHDAVQLNNLLLKLGLTHQPLDPATVEII